jgi:hypothetical protein
MPDHMIILGAKRYHSTYRVKDGFNIHNSKSDQNEVSYQIKREQAQGDYGENAEYDAQQIVESDC